MDLPKGLSYVDEEASLPKGLSYVDDLPAGLSYVDEDQSTAETNRLSKHVKQVPNETIAERNRLGLLPETAPVSTEETAPNSYRARLVKQAADPDNVPQSLGRGVLRTLARTGDAITRMSPDYNPADAMNLQAMVPAKRNNWDTAGEIATDVALAAAPLSKAARLGDLLRKAPVVGKAAPLVTSVAANSGWSAVTTPENRTEAAALGALGSAGGALVNKVVGNPIQQSVGSLNQLKEGFPVPPGMGAANPLIRGTVGGIEKTAERIPVLGQTFAKAKQRYLDSIDDFMVRETGEKATSSSFINTMQSASSSKDAAAAKVLYDNLARASTGKDWMKAAVTVSSALAHPGIPGVPAVIAFVGSLPMGQKALTGQYPMQKFLQENPTVLHQLGRVLATSSGVQSE